MSLLTNIQAAYNFDTVNTLTDLTGNGYNLTNNGTVTFGAGLIGNCAIFGTSNTTKYLSNATNLGITTGNHDWSISYWWQSGNVGVICGATYFIYGGGTNGIFCIYDGANNRYFLQSQGSGGNLIPAAAASINTWYHVCIVNSSNTLTLYVNNVSLGTLSMSTTTTGLSEKITIGQQQTNFGQGNMDAYFVWSRALTTGEVSQLYNSGTGLQYAFGVNSYWVGGTGNWSGANTANWSNSTGGPTGAAVPSSSSNVIFDANSGSGTCTVTAAATVSTINSSATSVALNTNGQTISASSINLGGTTTLGASAITVSGTGTVWTAAGTLTSNTSTITMSDTSAATKTFAGGGLIYNTLTMTGGSGSGAYIISGSNTFNTFSITNPKSTINFTAGTTQTITGSNFNVSGTAGNLNTLQSTTSGSYWSVASTSLISIDYVSLQDSHAVY